MRFSMQKVLTIARREYLTTVRRRAFVLTLLLTPAIFLLAGVMSTKMQVDDAVARASTARAVALVDSSGLFLDAPRSFEYRAPTGLLLTQRPGMKPATPRPNVPVVFRPMASQAEAIDSLEQGKVKQVLVVSPDFMQSGRVRLYEKDTRVFTSSSDDRPLRNWMVRALLAGKADSAHIDKTLSLDRSMAFYTQDRLGRWAIKDDAKEWTGFLLPFALGFLLAMSIVMGGQYLLQGVSEEKESRILESLMCSVTPDELLAGKLLGLGGAGLTLVAVWIGAGSVSASSMLALANVSIPTSLLVLGFCYFIVGYLFYGALMLSVGSMTANLREATQISGYVTLLMMCPFWLMVKFLNDPGSGIAVGMSLFPPTAPTSMMLRMSASVVSGALIPPWQIALSLGLLGLSAIVMLMIGSRLFRLGMLLYGKTPNLPEILRILRQK